MRKLKAPRNTWKVYVNNRYLMDYIFTKVLNLQADQISKVARAIDNYTKISPDEYPEYLSETGLDKLQIGKLIDFLKQDLTYIEKLKGESRGAKELVELFAMCKELGLTSFEFKPYIMRGITYYTGTVIEMFDIGGDKNPRALFGGGRYDDLLEIFGKEKLPAFGIGWGSVTMMNYLETYNLLPEYSEGLNAFITLTPGQNLLESFNLADKLRDEGIKVETQLKEEDLKKQLGTANKRKIRYVFFKSGDKWIAKDMGKGIQSNLNLEDIKGYFVN